MSEQEPHLHVSLEANGPRVIGTPSQSLGQVNLPESLRNGKDVFAEWQWDGSTVIVRNCRFGFFPIFYYATKSEFGVSPSIERLLKYGAPPDLDDAAIAVFLRLGFLLGEDTVFRAIRMVPPGGEIRWNGGEPKVTGGYTFPQNQNLSRKAAVEGYGELFRQAIQRRASKEVRFGLPLSGGRDSRHILLELNSLGCLPELCFTNHDFPPYREENIMIGKLLAERLNIPHHILGQQGSRTAAELKKNRLNNYGAMENIWCINLYPAVAKITPIVYEGSGGNTIHASYLKREHETLLEQGKFIELSDQLLDIWSWKISEDALDRVLSDEAIRRFARDMAVERLAKELAKHSSAASPLASFYFWNRERRVAALQPFAIAAEAGISAITPYLDHDLLDFQLSLPLSTYMDKTFRTETIRKMHPEFDDIPYAGDKNTPPIEDNLSYRRFLLETGAYLAVNGKGWLVKREPNVRRLMALSFGRGNLRMRMSWIIPFSVLYMAQLEKLCFSTRNKK